MSAKGRFYNNIMTNVVYAKARARLVYATLKVTTQRLLVVLEGFKFLISLMSAACRPLPPRQWKAKRKSTNAAILLQVYRQCGTA